MHINFITLCSGDYWMGYAALVESIRRNSELDPSEYSFHVFTSGEIPDYAQEWLSSRSETVTIEDSSVLNTIIPRVPQEQVRLEESLKKITLFGKSFGSHGDAHVLIDSDMVCLGSLTDIRKKLGYWASINAMDQFVDADDEMINEINGGLVIFTPSRENCETLTAIYNAQPQQYTKAADQDVLNEWNRKTDSFQFLGSDWNCLKTVFRNYTPSERRKILQRTRILHFILDKPWGIPRPAAKFSLQRSQYRIERIWWQLYAQSGMQDPGTFPFRAQLYPLWRYLRSAASAMWQRMQTKARRAIKRVLKCCFQIRALRRLTNRLFEMSRRLRRLAQAGDTATEVFSRNDNDRINTIFSEKIVLNGPFKGMNYPTLRAASSAVWPKLLGSYESELNPILERWKSFAFENIIDVGCAEGYFAVGFARLWPTAQIFAFDIDPQARDLCRSMALANCAENRVSIKERFSGEFLRTLPAAAKSLFMCDIDGAEYEVILELLEQPNLENTYIIVETHDFEGIDRTAQIQEVLIRTHYVKIIHGSDDYRRPLRQNYPQLKGLTFQEQFEILAEYRPHPQNWVIAEPKQNG